MTITLDHVAERCRDAAFGDCDFDTLLRTVCTFVGGDKALLLGAGPASDIGCNYAIGHDPAVLADYQETWRHDDPRRFHSLKTPVGTSALGQAYRRNEELDGTPYFEAISLKGNVADSVHGIISDNATTGRMSVSVHRGFQHERFAEAERERLAAVLPMLRSAIEDSVRAALIAGGAGRGSFHAIVDEAGEVAWSGGARHLSAPIGLDRASSRTGPGSPREQALLTALANARKGHRTTLNFGHIRIDVSPLPPMLGWKREWAGMAMLVARSHEGDPGLRAVDLFARAHGFSYGETEMLAALTQHGDVKRAAQSLAISDATARWHVSNMLAKCHLRSEIDLVQATVTGRIAN